VRVFLVDDDPMLRHLMRCSLGQEPAVRIVGEAASGEEALEALDGVEADLVVMDYVMPGLDGAETTARLRARDCMATVLGWTSAHDALVRRRFELAGAAEVYDKADIDGVLAYVSGRSPQPELAA
jgi:DNA-binding NarL/FixJ family response regulator